MGRGAGAGSREKPGDKERAGGLGESSPRLGNGGPCCGLGLRLRLGAGSSQHWPRRTDTRPSARGRGATTGSTHSAPAHCPPPTSLLGLCCPRDADEVSARVPGAPQGGAVPRPSRELACWRGKPGWGGEALWPPGRRLGPLCCHTPAATLISFPVVAAGGGMGTLRSLTSNRTTLLVCRQTERSRHSEPQGHRAGVTLAPHSQGDRPRPALERAVPPHTPLCC